MNHLSDNRIKHSATDLNGLVTVSVFGYDGGLRLSGDCKEVSTVSMSFDAFVEDHIEWINFNYINTLLGFYLYVKKVAIQFGENLMPTDIAKIMSKASRSGRYCRILTNGFTTWKGLLPFMFDIYKGCGFLLDEDEDNTVENFQRYF